ncbi:MAG: hypothetical protein LUD47_07980 [Clostridia bacterium]|nr:hypothetical protein [Clostridia bacterium]
MDCYAFILEGDTELEFYRTLLRYLCDKHSVRITKIDDGEFNDDYTYELVSGSRRSILKFKEANSVSNMPKSGDWFYTKCFLRYGSENHWTVFLCYDTDTYNDYISVGYRDDWNDLRESLKKADKVIDLAAKADIEDVLLQDIAGVCNYLNCPIPASLKGSKGKRKMRNLFMQNEKYYHAGERAREMIESLDMGVIMGSGILPLNEMENIVFKNK